MDNTINNDIIEKVTIKSVAIYKAIAMLPPIETKDLWEEKNSIEHQKNYENKNVSETNDTMKNTKMPSTPNDWRDITDPKLRKKAYNKSYCKTYYTQNKNELNIKGKKWKEKNKELVRKIQKQYRSINKEKLDKYNVEWKRKNKNNVQYNISCNLRRRLNKALNRNYKSGSAVRDLGCSIDELKIYLESKFQSGMNWDNYGLYGWHIDHIKPLASFDLTDRNQLLEACHYTNLQPLWANDNLTKGSTHP
jgi:hypothetical protein